MYRLVLFTFAVGVGFCLVAQLVIAVSAHQPAPGALMRLMGLYLFVVPSMVLSLGLLAMLEGGGANLPAKLRKTLAFLSIVVMIFEGTLLLWG